MTHKQELILRIYLSTILFIMVTALSIGLFFFEVPEGNRDQLNVLLGALTTAFIFQFAGTMRTMRRKD